MANWCGPARRGRQALEHRGSAGHAGFAGHRSGITHAALGDSANGLTRRGDEVINRAQEAFAAAGSLSRLTGDRGVALGGGGAGAATRNIGDNRSIQSGNSLNI